MSEFLKNVVMSQMPFEQVLLKELSMEGIIRSELMNVAGLVVNAGTSVKGWIENVGEKQRHINEYAQETISWLKQEDRANPRLDLDENAFFKTKGKRSGWWRYYFLLNDVMYDEITTALKKGDSSAIEKWAGMNIESLFYLHWEVAAGKRVGKDERRLLEAQDHLNNIRDIKDLMVVVETYRSRCNKVFDLIISRNRTIKGFPFQLMLKGMSDLDSIVKQIVRLAK